MRTSVGMRSRMGASDAKNTMLRVCAGADSAQPLRPVKTVSSQRAGPEAKHVVLLVMTSIQAPASVPTGSVGGAWQMRSVPALRR